MLIALALLLLGNYRREFTPVGGGVGGAPKYADVQKWTSEVGICWLLLEAAASGATGKRPGGFESSWLELGAGGAAG